MSAAFTPGPWTREEDDEYSLILSGADGICLLEGHTVGPYQPKLREANANLIAAAPDLYEALSNFLERMAITPMNLDVAGWSDIAAPAVAALAKARGEQVPA